jgi:hypothetical protein
MPAYIDQRQLHDIDNCMKHIKGAMPEIYNFVKELDLYSNGGNPYNLLPWIEEVIDMRRLQRIHRPAAERAQQWFDLTEKPRIERLSSELDEIHFLISYILDASYNTFGPEQRFPMVQVAKLPIPARRFSLSDDRLDCSRLLERYHHRAMVIAEDLSNNQEAYKAQRIATTESLPRFADYMQVHLNSFSGRSWPADRLESARQRLKDNIDHYQLGINAKGSFITHHTRISALVERLNRGLTASVQSPTIFSFTLEMELILPLLIKARHYVEELKVLRGSV